MMTIIIINIIVVIEHKKLYVQQDEKQHKKTTKQKTDIGVVNARVQKPHFEKRKKIFTNLKGKVFSQIQIIFCLLLLMLSTLHIFVNLVLFYIRIKYLILFRRRVGISKKTKKKKANNFFGVKNH